MLFQRDEKTAERDWRHGQEIGEAEREALCAELGGEPEGDNVLSPASWPDGSEHTTPGRWCVMAEDNKVSRPE